MADKADLHIHTTCSDGKLTPEEAVLMASKKKLKALSITDHDTFKGYHLAKEKAIELGIDLIPGVEITSTFRSRECHLLAYYFEPESEFFKNFVLKQRYSRKNRIKGIIDKLVKSGIDINYDEVWALANGANIGRPHVAEILIDKGYVSSIQEAFKRYLSEEQLKGIDNEYPSIQEAIGVVKSVGGAAMLAHPGRFYSTEEVEELIDYGLDGLECIHPSHDWKTQLRYAELCEKRSLLKCGGSDYHGGTDDGYTNIGVVSIAMKYVDRIKRMTDQRKKIIEVKD